MTSVQSAPTRPTVEFTSAMEQHRSFLLRLARTQLDEALAEDAVQETLLAAWTGSERFNGDSALRTWLVAILRFKIIDQIRSRQRHRGVNHSCSGDGMDSPDDPFEALFDEDGRWLEAPQDWHPDVAEDVARSQLVRLLEECMKRLPGPTSRVFLMREYLGFEPVEIAEQTGLAAGNVRVILYRARMSLRSCLALSVPMEPTNVQ